MAFSGQNATGVNEDSKFHALPNSGESNLILEKIFGKKIFRIFFLGKNPNPMRNPMLSNSFIMGRYGK
jgi:hypothetical protein